MASLKESISKTVTKANEFITDKQRRYRINESLHKENAKLAALFNELGKVTYYGKPLISGRSAQVIKDDIAMCNNNIESLTLQLSETTKA